MNIKRPVLILLFSLLLVPGILHSQDLMKITYAQGKGLSVVRANVNVYFDLQKESVLDLVLQPGDILLTEEDTIVEVTILTDQSILFIAENTTFVFEDLNENGGGLFNLVYGRIRAKVNTLSENSHFIVRGQDTVAGVRGTDFGFDQIYDLENPESERISKIYCFEGSVAVSKKTWEANQFQKMLVESDSIVIRNDEMIEYSSNEPHEPFSKKEIQDEIYEFWGIREGQLEPIPPLSQTSDELPPVEFPDNFQPIQPQVVSETQIRMRKVGGIMFSLGAAAFSGSMIYYSLSPPENRPVGLALGGFSGTISLMGGGFFVASYFTPSEPTEEIP